MGRRAPGICSVCGGNTSRRSYSLCGACNRAGGSIQPPPPDRPAQAPPAGPIDSSTRILNTLKYGSKTTEELVQVTSLSADTVLGTIMAMVRQGRNVHHLGGRWSLEKVPVSLGALGSAGSPDGPTFEYVSRPDNTYVFGVSSDQHLCSRYAREDVLADLYDRFAKAGVDRVINAGNWIDGEDEKNRFDLAVHGLQPQVEYLVNHYPRRDGLVTYAVWGEDHEGWFARRESIDVGRFTENLMRQAGRQDWVDLGFIEAKIDLINGNTGARSSLVAMHPGGGSSYAYSYRPQKIVESLSGGEKPGALVIGHYHKLSCNIIRNVWTIQAGTSMDQSVFMRKKGLEAHVGGLIITLEQDPVTGALCGCTSTQLIYYDRAYYNGRWSKTGAVTQSPRFLGGVVPLGA